MRAIICILMLGLVRCQAPTTISGSTLKGFSIANAAAGNDPVFNNVTHVWHLEEASGNARVDSKGGISLTESGGTVASVAGIHNTAASFSSNGHALQETTYGFPVGSSIVAWAKQTTQQDDWIWQGINDNDPGLTINGDGTISLITAADGSLDSKTFAAGAWHMVVVCVSSGFMQWSIDGAALSAQLSTSADPDGTTIKVGASVTADLLYVDELMTFNVILSNANVTTLWNGGAGTFYSP